MFCLTRFLRLNIRYSQGSDFKAYDSIFMYEIEILFLYTNLFHVILNSHTK